MALKDAKKFEIEIAIYRKVASSNTSIGGGEGGEVLPRINDNESFVSRNLVKSEQSAARQHPEK